MAAVGAGCITVVTPRVPVPLPPDTVAVGAFGLGMTGVELDSDVYNIRNAGAVGGAVAAQVAQAEGFLFEVDGAAGIGSVELREAFIGASAGGRVWHAFGATEELFVGADLNATALLSDRVRFNIYYFAVNTAVQMELRALLSLHVWDAMWVGARPGMVAVGAADDALLVDVPLAIVWEKDGWRIGLEAGASVPAGRSSGLPPAPHAAALFMRYFRLKVLAR